MTTANLDHHDLVNATDKPGGPLVREDVMEQIWEWDSFPRPFVDMCSQTDRATNRYVEFTDDALGAPVIDNAHVDGADLTGLNDASTGQRQGNQCQIVAKVVQVSRRANNANSVGRAGTRTYQIMQAQKRAKRDQEAILLSDQGSVEDDGNTTAGRLGGFFAMVATNAVMGATGSSGGFNPATKLITAPTLGTPAAISEAAFKDLLQSIWEEGGEPTYAVGRGAVTRKMSEYFIAGGQAASQVNQNMGEVGRNPASGAVDTNKAYTAVTMIVTDWGVITLLPNRLHPLANSGQNANHSHLAIVDPRGCRIPYIEGFVTVSMGVVGLSTRDFVTADFTLRMDERIQGAYRDIDETAAMVA